MKREKIKPDMCQITWTCPKCYSSNICSHSFDFCSECNHKVEFDI